MKNTKLKDIGGLNGNTVKALAVGGVVTMADYMGLNNNQLLEIKGVGVASTIALANSLQSQIKQFRAEADLDVPGHPDETVLDAEAPGFPDVGMAEEVMVLPEPTEVDVNDIPDPDYAEGPELVPKPFKMKDVGLAQQQEQESRTQSQEPEEIFQQDQDFIGKSNEHQYPAKEDPRKEEVFLIDVNPGLFKNHEEAVSFICDWMIASQPFIRIPNTEHNLQRAFVMRWKEHVRREE